MLQESPSTAHEDTTLRLPMQAKEEWEINRERILFKPRRKLGAGQFGEVWEGVLDANTQVAIKKMLKVGAISSEEFLQEAELMKGLSHPKLLQLYGVATKTEPVYIVTELAELGSLFCYIREDSRSLELPQLITMCKDVVEGMAYLESQNCIHGDLAARNILVTEKTVCKVADFRFAARIKDFLFDKPYFEEPPSLKFPIKWTAPEAALNYQLSSKSDVWSFGIFLHEVITHCQFLPYRGMTNGEVLYKIQQGYRMPQPQGCPDKLYAIMQNCWKKDPDSRPTFHTLQGQLEDAEDCACEPEGPKIKPRIPRINSKVKKISSS